jgi:hypothetical protein
MKSYDVEIRPNEKGVFFHFSNVISWRDRYNFMYSVLPFGGAILTVNVPYSSDSTRRTWSNFGIRNIEEALELAARIQGV